MSQPPSGTLRDITIRPWKRCRRDVIACEDSRVTRRLLDHYGISTAADPLSRAQCAAARPKLLARLAQHEIVAWSDAGNALLISDPGFKRSARPVRLLSRRCRAGALGALAR